MNVSSAVERLMAEGIKEDSSQKIIDPGFPGISVSEPTAEEDRDHQKGVYCKIVVESETTDVSVTTIVKVASPETGGAG